MFDIAGIVADAFVWAVRDLGDCVCCLKKVLKKEFIWAMLHSILLWILARLTGCH